MDHHVTELPGDDSAIESPSDEGKGSDDRRIPLLVFAVVSLGFVLYLALGSVEARIWRFGRLNFEDRTVRHVWSYFGDHLPEMPGQPVITALYWISLAVMIVGTILGLWLFLGTPDEDPASEAIIGTPEQQTPHA